MIIPGTAAPIAGHAPGCACCTGRAGTVAHDNPPGLTTVAYRAGTHGSFKQAMLARLSAPEFPALAGLRTREDDDPAIALLDAFAATADILTFYQERIIQESYLPTATEPEALSALAGLVGYAPGAGVAASVDLALTLEPAPGAPEQALAGTNLSPGLRVQSIPGPGQTSQAYETIEPIEARVAWNSFAPRRTVPFLPRAGDRVAWIGAGVALRPGDALLFVTRNRTAGGAGWSLRFVVSVEPDAAANRQGVTLDGTIDAGAANAAGPPRVFALRARTALFGASAPNPAALTAAVRTALGGTATDWAFAFTDGVVLLDQALPSVVAGGWLVLATATARALFRINRAKETALAAYGLSGRATEVVPDTAAGLSQFDAAAYRGTAAYAGSEPLPLAEAPLIDPVLGDLIVLDRPVPTLPEGRRLILRGRAAVVLAPASATLTGADGSTRAVAEGARLVLAAAPRDLGNGQARWLLRDADGFLGALTLSDDPLFAIAGTEAPQITEVVTLLRQEAADPAHAALRLTQPLAAAFDRASLTILGNIARATHGEAVSEILGGGYPGRGSQSFTLAQAPLTYTRTREGRGAASSLTIDAGGIRWQEVPTLLDQGPRDRVFSTSLGADGKLTLRFGDGREGARLPAGQNNIHARYRRGTGLAGLAPAGAVSLLTARPLGLKAAENPMPAEGAQNPEGPEDLRRNAPASVLTLGRVVSHGDVADFAAGFAGIAKARADLVWAGAARRIFVTVAGPDGATVGDETLDALRAALGRAAEPGLLLALGPARPVRARLRLRLQLVPQWEPEPVRAAVAAILARRFGFSARAFAEPMALSAVIAAVVAVPGVLGAQAQHFARDVPPDNALIAHPRLRAAGAGPGADGTLRGAELLLLEANPDIAVVP
ncbi:putative baseplate assembly protein [Humitalea sp. 24SJ18S-53]|uniref:putative baseplate assembly protein n=1 Tax=Humitalea sp. 24SJ18S-53 TaxID=3422307 RepID=UPI003D66BED5